MNLIYLNKRGDEGNTRGWVYYRVTSTTGMGIDAGTEGSTVRVCRVKWPTFSDIGDIIDTPGTVGYMSAHPNVVGIVRQWGINHEDSILIGVLE